MWIVAIAWMYVAVMMAVAEASSPQGSLLGAFFTLLLYGIAPLALVMYLLGTPARRRARQAREAAEQAAAATAAHEAAASEPPPPALSAGLDPDAGGLPPAAPVPAEGKEAR